MRHAIKNSSKKTALPPGELVYIGDGESQLFRLTTIRYHQHEFSEEQSSEGTTDLLNTPEDKVTWINLDGIQNTTMISAIGKHFQLHPLLLEDILNTTQRPKLDEYDDALYIVFKMLTRPKASKRIRVEQISLLLGPTFVLTFQETQGDLFDPIRERLRQGKGQIRRLGPDFLAYSLLDTTIDHYFEIAETLYDEVELLQERILKQPNKSVAKNIHQLRQQCLILRKTSWPTRILAEQMLKSTSPLIKENTKVFLRDVVDHMIRITEAVSSLEDMLNSAMETFLAATNQKTNDTMRVLTVVATIFMPLTFITSVYGMNFRYMPELNWTYGYAGVWAVLLATAAGLLIYFRAKKWF